MDMETEVLIVGARPVGLFLANECVRRGLRWRIIETNSGQSVHSKALAIFPRKLETLGGSYFGAAKFLPACMNASTLLLSISAEPVSTKLGMGAKLSFDQSASSDDGL